MGADLHQPPPEAPRRTGLFVSLGLMILVLASFSPALWADFINFDDPQYVLDNPHVRTGLTWENVTWAFSAFHASNWHPLTWISLMADANLTAALGTSARLQPALVHHLTNVLLHAANAIILFHLLRAIAGRSPGSAWRAAVVAAIFAIHPQRVESVAWVSERKDVLSACFGLLCLRVYVPYARNPSFARYLQVFMSLALSLLAKPMLVTLPFVMILLDFWPLDRMRIPGLISADRPGGAPSSAAKTPLPRLIAEKLPLLALAVGSCVVTYLAQSSGGAVRTVEEISFTQRLANAPVAYVGYLWKTLWPSGLAVIYPLPPHRPAAIVAASTILLLGITLASFALIRTRPHLAVGWLWFVGVLVPVIGIVQVGGQSMADRYTYFPVIGLLIMLAWSLPEPRDASLTIRRVGVVGAALILIALAAATFNQARKWRDSVTLFQYTVDVTEPNWIAHRNLGFAWMDKGRPDLAIQNYRAALAVAEGVPLIHNNLGVALVRVGDPAGAARAFNRALQLRPQYPEAALNLGVALSLAGDAQAASVRLKEVLADQPSQPQALYQYARSLAALGRTDEAVAAFRRAVDAQPRQAEVRNSFGIALAKAGRFAEARDQFQEAVNLKPDFADARQNLERASGMLSPPSPAPYPNNAPASGPR